MMSSMRSTRLLIVVASFVTFLILLFTPNILGLFGKLAYADFNFAGVGDWGCNSNSKNTVTNIQGKNPERVLALGDYSYTSTATCWLNTINPIKSITRINIGNHENDADEGNSQYMKAFGLGKQYYSFDYVNTHVLTMASEISFSKGSAQYNFVENDLKTAAANPNIKWIIVNYHRVMYTSPNTCSASTCKGSSSLRDAYHPLFDKYRVDLVLQAHVHNYQRTYPLKYDTVSPSSPIRTSTSTSSYTDPEGEIFATVGTGGINFNGLSGKSSFVVKQQAQKFGQLDILIANDGSKLTGKYYRNGESSPYDTFTITKPTSISMFKSSTANKVNTTHQTGPQIIIDQFPSSGTGRNSSSNNNNQTAETRENITSNDRKNIIVPDLSEIINRTRTSENLATKDDNSQKEQSADTNTEDSVLADKPIISKEAEKNIGPVRNNQPEANAGKNQIVIEGSQIVLDGSKSKDSDGKIESYIWQQISGPSIALDNPNDLKTSFISPTINQNTILVFKLTVTDDKGSSDSAITTVKIVNNGELPSSLSSSIPDSSTSNPSDNSIKTEPVINSSLD